MSFIFALAAIIFFYNKRWGSWYMFLGLVMGVARIYTGVHWPLDIVGGIGLGLACGVIVHLLVPKQKGIISAAEQAVAKAERDRDF